ncbi:MAG: putative quinol monooxygenase [Pseudomonadota bacterium]
MTTSAARWPIIVEFDVIPERSDEFAEMFNREFVPRSQAEEGCELYELWRDPGDRSKFAVVERWTTKSHHDAHLAAAWFQEWSPVMESFQATPLVIRWMEMTGA